MPALNHRAVPALNHRAFLLAIGEMHGKAFLCPSSSLFLCTVVPTWSPVEESFRSWPLLQVAENYQIHDKIAKSSDRVKIFPLLIKLYILITKNWRNEKQTKNYNKEYYVGYSPTTQVKPLLTLSHIFCRIF